MRQQPEPIENETRQLPIKLNRENTNESKTGALSNNKQTPACCLVLLGQALGVLGQHRCIPVYFMLRWYSRGETPVSRRNIWVKWLLSENPTAAITSVMLRSPSLSKHFAFCIR